MRTRLKSVSEDRSGRYRFRSPHALQHQLLGVHVPLMSHLPEIHQLCFPRALPQRLQALGLLPATLPEHFFAASLMTRCGTATSD